MFLRRRQNDDALYSSILQQIADLNIGVSVARIANLAATPEERVRLAEK
jgi:hypothetical protein